MNYNDIPSLVDYETREEFIDKAASKAKDNMIFIEVGVFLGGTICRLASKIQERGINCKIYAIDSWEYPSLSKESYAFANSFSKTYTETIGIIRNGEDGFEAFKKTIALLNLNIEYIKSDSGEVSQNFENNSVDYLFLDASHDPNGIKKELEMWMPKLKESSLVGIHDYCNGTGGPAEEFLGYKLSTTSNKATGIIRDTL